MGLNGLEKACWTYSLLIYSIKGVSECIKVSLNVYMYGGFIYLDLSGTIFLSSVKLGVTRTLNSVYEF